MTPRLRVRPPHPWRLAVSTAMVRPAMAGVTLLRVGALLVAHRMRSARRLGEVEA